MNLPHKQKNRAKRPIIPHPWLTHVASYITFTDFARETREIYEKKKIAIRLSRLFASFAGKFLVRLFSSSFAIIRIISGQILFPFFASFRVFRGQYFL